MSLPHSIDPTLAGYRIIRKLAAGSRSDAFLGASGTGSVVLKVFRSELHDDDIADELRALGRLDSPHFVRLVDISRSGSQLPVLVLGRVQRGSVAALLRDRGSIESGEAVTLLAPLAGALPSLHAQGIAHTRIGASTVHLGSAGEPVLLGFGHCVHFAPAASVAVLEAEPAAVADLDGIAALARLVLSHVRGQDRALHELTDWIQMTPRQHDFASRLEGKLFELAQPQPIEFGREPNPQYALPGRTIEPLPAMIEQDPDPVPDWLHGAIMTNPLSGIGARVLTAAKSVRRPFWIAAGAIVVALVVALSVIPQGAPAKVVPAAAADPATSATPVASAAALPTDPVAALPILLAARNRCVSELSVLCLDDVDEASSGAYTEDAAVIRQIQSGGEVSKDATLAAPHPKLAEQLGDVVLVDLGTQGNTAAVELIDENGGWRIRNYVSGSQSGG